MYEYNRRRKIGPFTILFLFIFSASLVGLSVISYLDRGRFWDILPYFSIPILVLSLVFAIYNLVRRCNAGFVFILFFIIFTIGLVLSSVFGPFALHRQAVSLMEEKDHEGAINRLDSILESYPSSRYAVQARELISYAYFEDGRYASALEAFDAAIEEGIIDGERLEVLDIRQEIHYQIALEKIEDGEYLEAAQSYMDSLEVLRQIKADFPDTNEAFIAQYKIPQYLFDASESYSRHGDTLSRIMLLEEIISEYPESDYYQPASEAIDGAYLDMALESSSASEYDEAIEWFLKFYETGQEEETGRAAEYKIDSIFQAVPPRVIKNQGDAAFMRSDLRTAVFMYEKLLQYGPELADSITENLAASKLSLARQKPHSDLFDSVSGRYINTPDSSLLAIVNNTGGQLDVYMQGPESYIAEVPPGETVETAAVPGEYDILVESQDAPGEVFLGSGMVLEEFRKYTRVFEAPEEESS